MTTARSAADEYPCRGVRFVNGRTRHRVRRPDDNRWWDLLYAACGKTGYKTDAYLLHDVPDCRDCEAAVAADNQQAA